MPIYEYRCTSCGYEKEVLQKMSESPLTDCPSCGKPAFSKLISAAGFQLKGSGWYATDFKGGSKPKGDSKSAGDGEQKGEGKTKEEPKSDAPKSDASACGAGACPACQ